MIIALDYDKTYTADPDLWDEFIARARKRNHKVICITMRYLNEPIRVNPLINSVYYTSRQAKLIWAKEHNIHVDIWIDDRPAWLFDNAADYNG